MDRVIFRKRQNFSRWIVIGLVLAVAVFSIGFVSGEVGPLFFGIGGLWIAVLIFVAVVVQSAGRYQVAQLSLAGARGLIVESNGLFGRGIPRLLPPNSTDNWRALTQASNSRGIGPSLGMLAFDVGKKTYRLPLTTADAADVAALSELAPAAMMILSAKYPKVEQLPKP